MHYGKQYYLVKFKNPKIAKIPLWFLRACNNCHFYKIPTMFGILSLSLNRAELFTKQLISAKQYIMHNYSLDFLSNQWKIWIYKPLAYEKSRADTYPCKYYKHCNKEQLKMISKYDSSLN